MIYGFIEISDVEVMLKTWSKIEIPPKPSKKADIIIFKEIALNGILAITDTPFVSSIIPAKSPLANEEGMFKVFSKGESTNSNKSNIPELFRIEIITLNNTTKPPIIRIVFIELMMLAPRIAPKLLKSGGSFLLILLSKLLYLFLVAFLPFFQNLKIIPTVKEARRCVKKSKRPIVVFPKREMPNSSNNKQRARIIGKSYKSFSFFFCTYSFFSKIGYNLSTYWISDL